MNGIVVKTFFWILNKPIQTNRRLSPLYQCEQGVLLFEETLYPTSIDNGLMVSFNGQGKSKAGPQELIIKLFVDSKLEPKNTRVLSVGQGEWSIAPSIQAWIAPPVPSPITIRVEIAGSNKFVSIPNFRFFEEGAGSVKIEEIEVVS